MLAVWLDNDENRLEWNGMEWGYIIKTGQYRRFVAWVKHSSRKWIGYIRLASFWLVISFSLTYPA